MRADSGDVATWAGRDEQAVAVTAGRVLGAARTLVEATSPDLGQPDQVAGLVERARTAAAEAHSVAQHAEATRERATSVLSEAGWGEGDRLRAIITAAQAWFLEQAAGSGVYAAAAAARGHSVPDALDLGAGYAPPGWTWLVDHLRAAGYSDREQLDAGVAGTTRTGRLIDRFRGRITFPIHDHQGVVGFTARDASGNPDAPKYLNTAATGLFAKGALLFGTQHLDRQQGTGTVVLVEGPWDALAVTAATGGSAVGLAVCGTAVTDHHLDLLHRLGPTLVLAPDADPAGTEAMRRTLAMLAEKGLPHPAAAATQPGTDLADVYAAGGAEAVRGTLGAARAAGIEYAQAFLAARPPGGTAQARVAAARAAAVFAAELPEPQRDELAAVLVGRGGVGEATARAVIDTIGPRTVVHPKAPTAAAASAEPDRRRTPAAIAL